MLCKTEQNSKVLFGWQSPALWSKKNMFQDTPSSFSDVGNQCIQKFSWNIALVLIKVLQASGLISFLIKYAQYTTAVAAGTKEKPFLCLRQQVGGQGSTRCFTWKSPASTDPKCRSAELPGERWPISCRWQTKHNEIDRVESYSKKVWEANLQFWKTKITTNRGSFHCGFRGSLKRVHSQKMMKKNTWSTAASPLKRIKTLSVDIHNSLMSTSKAKLHVVWEVSWRDTGLFGSVADPQHKTLATRHRMQSTYMQSKSCFLTSCMISTATCVFTDLYDSIPPAQLMHCYVASLVGSTVRPNLCHGN